MLAALRHLSPCPACGAAPTGPDACCRACLEAMFSPRLAGGVLALGAHRGRLRRALMAYKYRGAARLAGPFGAELARLVASTGWRPEAVTSVPPHPGRVRQRGYDQGALLARAVARHLGLPCVPYLRRSRRVGQQARLGGAARRDNARGAFEVDPAALPLPRGPLLLVDDVFTTGATSDACRHALLAAGASRVLVAVVAARAKCVPAEPPREVDPPPGRPAGPGPHRRLGPAAARARPLSRFRG